MELLKKVSELRVKRRYGMKILKKQSLFSNVLSILYKISPLYTVLIFIQGIIIALIPSLQILVTSKFINTVLAVVKNSSNTEDMYLPLLGIIIILAYSMLSEMVLYFFKIRFKNLIRSKFNISLVEKYGKLAYKYLESTETVDLISRVFRYSEEQLLETLGNMVKFLSLIITIIGIMVILISKVWWTAVLIIAFSIPLFKIAIKSGQAGYQAGRKMTRYIRQYEYLGELLTKRDNIEERSLFAYQDVLNRRWEENFEKARKKIFITEMKWFIRLKSGALITSFISLFIILALLPSVFSKVISIGMFIALVNASFNLVSRMSRDLTNIMDQLARNMEFVRDLMDFLELEEVEGVLAKPSTARIKLESIEFKDVSFKYPGTDTYILRNLSLRIQKGKHYAIVGLNGAGKTTIIKLLTGLYRDFKGKILINGRLILSYSQADLKALCAVAYQDFMKYSISVKENIAIGDINNLDNNESEIKKALELMELNEIVNRLPAGIETPLGKIRENGVDFSGGQWQKLALARFAINPASLRILDEPTAAIDPISESRMYEKFEELSKGQTTIFISHRLGSTMLADHIFVIKEGRVIEEGSHQELMENNSDYAQLYESQRSWYK